MNEQNTDIRFIANREVRVIPKGWQHLKDGRGKHIPLLPADYVFDDDEHRASCGGLMPEVHGEAEIAAYETTTEGTPISPEFPNTPEGRLALVRHCAEHERTFGNHRADAEAWAAILFGCATVDLNGTVRAQC